MLAYVKCRDSAVNLQTLPDLGYSMQQVCGVFILLGGAAPNAFTSNKFLPGLLSSESGTGLNLISTPVTVIPAEA